MRDINGDPNMLERIKKYKEARIPSLSDIHPLFSQGEFLVKYLTFDQCVDVLKQNKIEPGMYMMTACSDDHHIDVRVAKRVVAGLFDQGLIGIDTIPKRPPLVNYHDDKKEVIASDS